MSQPRRPLPVRTRLVLVPLLALAAVSLVGCDSGPRAPSPRAALAAAKKYLDATSGVSIDLHTDKLPQGVSGVTDANGVGTHAPAFDGQLTVLVNNLSVKVPVVSLSGTVYAKLPFTTAFVPLDPSDYGAPDPANLMDPTGGISSWLTAAKDVKQGDETRDGDTVLATYRGTVPGTAVAAVIPSATKTASFPVTFRLDDKRRLASADISGPFYGGKGTV
ncbi:MAG: lipoprotein LprG, partial [Nocardioidaceae bacterium]|nr:lipoprotein LprG [Nocardioidaceae bacterium]